MTAEDPAPTICVIAYSKAVRDAIAGQFSVAGIKTQVIEATEKSLAGSGTVQFATMHRAKGLEFDSVLVVVPASYLGDPVETGDQRRLVYVALTRAKREAVVLKV